MIDTKEFLEMLDEPRSPFTDALFSLVDVDGSGKIDFSEFIQVLTSYCIYSKTDVLRFAFDIFDVDGSGALDENEFTQMMCAINANNPVFPGNFKKALEQFDINGDGLIDFDEFRRLHKRFPMVLFPAFRLQDRMQKATLGEGKWLSILKAKARSEYIHQYKIEHNGALPPETQCERCFDVVFSSRSSRAKYM